MNFLGTKERPADGLREWGSTCFGVFTWALGRGPRSQIATNLCLINEDAVSLRVWPWRWPSATQTPDVTPPVSVGQPGEQHPHLCSVAWTGGAAAGHFTWWTLSTGPQQRSTETESKLLEIVTDIVETTLSIEANN